MLGGSLGHLVEWYDWFVYASTAIYFAPIFFPSRDPTAQLLGAAGIFAVGFLFRPVGAWMIGSYADRHGRRAALSLSVILMGAGSLIVAIAPGYETIGIGAPILLLLARVVQGISVGGESGANSAYITEVADPAHRGFWASWSSVNLSLGQLVALLLLMLLQAVMPSAALGVWGWRIAFALGTVFAGVALWLRRGIVESEAFAAQTGAPMRGRLKGLWPHRRAFATVFCLTAGAAPIFYAFTSYLQKYLVKTSGFSRSQATIVAAGALIVFIVLQPIGGILSDRVGRKPLLLAFGVLATVFTIPLFRALEHATTPLDAFLVSSAAMVVLTCYTSISTIVKAELFPVATRALGAALPFALAQSLVSGTVEYLALLLKQNGHESWFYGYVAGWSLLFLIVALVTPETRPPCEIDRRALRLPTTCRR